MSKNYYKILDILPTASEEEIKKAFHKKALLYHPDRNIGFQMEAEQKMKEINEAKEILLDKNRRSRYDESYDDTTNQKIEKDIENTQKERKNNKEVEKENKNTKSKDTIGERGYALLYYMFGLGLFFIIYEGITLRSIGLLFGTILLFSIWKLIPKLKKN